MINNPFPTGDDDLNEAMIQFNTDQRFMRRAAMPQTDWYRNSLGESISESEYAQQISPGFTQPERPHPLSGSIRISDPQDEDYIARRSRQLWRQTSAIPGNMTPFLQPGNVGASQRSTPLQSAQDSLGLDELLGKLQGSNRRSDTSFSLKSGVDIGRTRFNPATGQQEPWTADVIEVNRSGRYNDEKWYIHRDELTGRKSMINAGKNLSGVNVVPDIAKPDGGIVSQDDSLVSMLTGEGKENIWSRLQASGSLNVNWRGMTPQFRAQLSSFVYLGANRQEQTENFNAINQSSESSPYYKFRNNTHAEDIDATANAMFGRRVRTDAAGNRMVQYASNKIKRFKNQAIGGTTRDAYAAEGVALPVYTAPARFEEQLQPDRGFRSVTVHDSEKLATGEGEKRGRRTLAATTFKRRVSDRAFEALESGQLYLAPGYKPDAVNEDLKFAGSSGDLSQLLGIRASGRSQVVLRKWQDDDGNNWVEYQNFADRVAMKKDDKGELVPVKESALPRVRLNGERVTADYISAVPGAKDVPTLAKNTYLAQGGTVQGLRKQYMSYLEAQYMNYKRAGRPEDDPTFEPIRAMESQLVDMGFDMRNKKTRAEAFGTIFDERGEIKLPGEEMFYHAAVDSFFSNQQMYADRNEIFSRGSLEQYMRGVLLSEAESRGGDAAAAINEALAGDSMGPIMGAFAQYGNRVNLTPEQAAIYQANNPDTAGLIQQDDEGFYYSRLQGIMPVRYEDVEDEDGNIRTVTRPTDLESAMNFQVEQYARPVYVNQTLDQVRSEYNRSETVVKPEAAEWMIQTRKELGAAWESMREGGMNRTDAFHMFRGVYANVSKDALDNLEIEELIHDFDPAAFEQAHLMAREQMAGMEMGEVQRQALLNYSEMMGHESAIRLNMQSGSVVLPAAGAMAGTLTQNESGELLVGPGQALIEALYSAAEVANYGADAPQDLVEQRDQNIYAALDETVSYLQNPEVQQKALGQEFPKLGGVSIINKRLPENEMLVSLARLQQLTGMDADEIRRRTSDEAYESGEGLVGAMMRFPNANPAASLPGARVRVFEFEQEKNSPIVRGRVEPPDTLETSAVIHEIMSGDTDGDRLEAYINLRRDAEGNLNGAPGRVSTAEELRKTSRNMPFSEFDKQVEEAQDRANPQAFQANVKKVLLGAGDKSIWQSREQMLQQFQEEEITGAGKIGEMYDSFLRRYRQGAMMMAGQIDPEQGDYYQTINKAASLTGFTAYQAPLDRESANDEHLDRLLAMSKTMTFDKKSGRPVYKEGENWREFNGVGDAALSIAEQLILSRGYQGDDPEERAAFEEQYRNREAMAAAAGILPQDVMKAAHDSGGLDDLLQRTIDEVVMPSRAKGALGADETRKLLELSQRDNSTQYGFGDKETATSLPYATAAVLGAAANRGGGFTSGTASINEAGRVMGAANAFHREVVKGTGIEGALDVLRENEGDFNIASPLLRELGATNAPDMSLREFVQSQMPDHMQVKHEDGRDFIEDAKGRTYLYPGVPNTGMAERPEVQIRPSAWGKGANEQEIAALAIAQTMTFGEDHRKEFVQELVKAGVVNKNTVTFDMPDAPQGDPNAAAMGDRMELEVARRTFGINSIPTGDGETYAPVDLSSNRGREDYKNYLATADRAGEVNPDTPIPGVFQFPVSNPGRLFARGLGDLIMPAGDGVARVTDVKAKKTRNFMHDLLGYGGNGGRVDPQIARQLGLYQESQEGQALEIQGQGYVVDSEFAQIVALDMGAVMKDGKVISPDDMTPTQFNEVVSSSREQLHKFYSGDMPAGYADTPELWERESAMGRELNAPGGSGMPIRLVPRQHMQQELDRVQPVYDRIKDQLGVAPRRANLKKDELPDPGEMAEATRAFLSGESPTLNMPPVGGGSREGGLTVSPDGGGSGRGGDGGGGQTDAAPAEEPEGQPSGGGGGGFSDEQFDRFLGALEGVSGGTTNNIIRNAPVPGARNMTDIYKGQLAFQDLQAQAQQLRSEGMSNFDMKRFNLNMRDFKAVRDMVARQRAIRNPLDGANPVRADQRDMEFEAFWSGADADVEQIAAMEREFGPDLAAMDRTQRMSRGSGGRSSAFSDKEFSEAESAAKRLVGLREEMGKLSQATEGFTKVQKEHLGQIQEITKSWTTLNRAAEKLGKAPEGSLSEDQRALKDAIKQTMSEAGPAAQRAMGVQADVKYGNTQVMPVPMAEDERQQRLIEGLLRGGRGGVRYRTSEAFDEIAEGGLETPFGSIRSRAALGALGAGMRTTSRLQNTLWGISHVQSQLIDPMMQNAEMYEQTEAQRQMMLAQSGAVSYEDMMSGAYGNLRRRQAGQETAQFEMGRQVHTAYGWMMGATGNEYSGRTMGAITAIGTPAIGAGIMGNAIGGPVTGAVAAGAALVASTANYFTQSTQDIQGIASTQRNYFSRIGERGFSTATMLEAGMSDPFGAASAGLASVFNPEGFEEGTRLAVAQEASSMYVRGDLAANMSMEDFVNLLMETQGLNRAEAEGAVFGEYKARRAGDGFSEEESQQMYSVMRMYGGDVSVSDQVWSDAERLSAVGITQLPEAGLAATQANMQSTFVTGNVMQSFRDITDYFNNMPAGANPQIERQRLDRDMQRVTSINQSRMMAGLDTVRWQDYGYNDPYKDDPLRQNLSDQMLTSEGDRRFAFQGYADATASVWSRNLTGRINAGDPVGFQRFMRQDQAMSGALENLTTYGSFSDQEYQMFAGAATSMGSTQFRRSMAMGQGDQLALSMYYGEMAHDARLGPGNIRARTINTDTGMSIFYRGMDGAATQQLRDNDEYGLFNLSDEEAAMGTRGWQNQILQISRGQETMQYEMGSRQRALNRSLAFGGGTIGADGRIEGGNDLSEARRVFEELGKSFMEGIEGNRYAGMGYLALEDAQRDLSREQQRYGVEQATKGREINLAQLDLQERQFYENFGLNTRQFQYSTGYQRQSMLIGREREVEQEQWQREDASFSRSQAELGFGWNMEDSDRNIRYARGRQRRDLMRQRERAVIQHSMDMAQRDVQEGRMGQREEWSEETYEREKKNFEQTTQFKEEEMAMNKRHFEEQMALRRQQFDLETEAHNKRIEWMQQEFELEDQRILLDRQNQEISMDMQDQMAEASREAQLEINRFNDALTRASDETSEVNAQIGIMAQRGELMRLTFTGATAAMAAVTQQSLEMYNASMKGLTDTSGAVASFIRSVVSAATNRNDDGGSASFGGSGNTSSNRPGVRQPSRHAHGGMPAADLISEMRNSMEWMRSGFSGGGYTGDGFKYEAAGIVHKGEYVVPQGGALVIRNDKTEEYLGKMVMLLQKLVDYGPMRLNAQINTNQQSVPVSELLSYDDIFASS